MSAEALSDSQKELKCHSLAPEEALRALKTSTDGLTQEEARRRLSIYGPNQLKEEKKITPFSIFMSQFKGILIIILLITAFISGFILGEYLDTIVILAIVIMNAILGFYQEYRAEKAVEALKKMVAPLARVLRENKETLLPSKEIVPGDIILVEAGDRIPADGRLLEAVIMKLDEAPLTGESNPVTKSTEPLPEETLLADRRNMIYMGTHTTFGRGRAVITGTGAATEFGKIAGMVQELEMEESPLKKNVEHLGRRLGLISLILCIWIFVIGFLVHQTSITELFMTTISMAVSAIPEGLPAVITVTLALGVGRMARQRAIVRKLASVETLGCTTVICSDKTGTLTKNEMTVKKIYANGEFIDVSGSGYEPKGEFLKNGSTLKTSRQDLDLLLRIGALCNNARLENGKKGWVMLGDPTEGALLTVAAKADLWPDKLAQEYPRVGELPFDSVRKMMSTIHASPDGRRMAYVKGAPEIILSQSSRLHYNGNPRKLQEKDRETVLEAGQRMAGEALRLLAFAYRELPDGLDANSTENVETDFTFVGLVGMIDPPREEVPEAVKLCRSAGISTIMITGDHKETAVAIAKRIGMIASNDSAVLTGAELDKMSDEQLAKIVSEVRVYARTSPEHKMRITNALKSKGHTVAMTGDGVNDAPAVKAADIGVAMGIKGTDVTKEASSMILEDDNFATIVSAVEEGRHIYENIKKYIRLMITVNFDEFLEITIASLAGLPLPLLPIQILWVNLVSDGLPALALSIDPKEQGLMDRPPRDPNEGILSKIWKFIFVGSSLDLISSLTPFLWGLTMGFTYWGPWGGDHPLAIKARTMAFTAVVFFEFILAYNCRSETHSILGLGRKGFTANKTLFCSVLVSAILQVAIIYTPAMQTIFNTTALAPHELLACTMGSILGFIILPGKLIKKSRYREGLLDKTMKL